MRGNDYGFFFVFLIYELQTFQRSSVFETVAIRALVCLEIGWLFMWCILSAFNEEKVRRRSQHQTFPLHSKPSLPKVMGTYLFSPCMLVYVYTACKCPRPSVILPRVWIAWEQWNCLPQINITVIHLENSGLSYPLYVVLPANTNCIPCCFPMAIHLAQSSACLP